MKSAYSTGAARTVLACLAVHADPKTRIAFPSEKLLKAESGLSERGLDEAIDRLVANGDVVITEEPRWHYPRHYYVAAGTPEAHEVRQRLSQQRLEAIRAQAQPRRHVWESEDDFNRRLAESPAVQHVHV